jgi:DNA-binding NtrC family response regulator
MRGPWLGGRRSTVACDGAARVLVATDDPDRGEILAKTIRAEGHCVVEASSVARTATHLFAAAEQRTPIDLIVIDGTSRPWVAAAVVTALRSAGCELPILLVLGDEPVMRAELGERHARIVDASAPVDDVRSAVGELVAEESRSADDPSCALSIDGFGWRVPAG